METEDIISLPANSPGNGSENNGHDQCERQSNNLDFQSEKLEIEEFKEIEEIPGSSGDSAEGDNQLLPAIDNGNNMLDDPPSLEISFAPTETVAVTKKETHFLPVHSDNGFPTAKDEIFLSNHKEDEFPLSNREIGASSLSGVKRPRKTVDEEQPLVKVTYNSLTRASKRKLEELLHQWSQWNAQHCSSSPESGKALESGEGTYFLAIQVGLDKPSAVSFWMENEAWKDVSKELIPIDENSVPLYDRGYSLALTSTDGSSNPGRSELGEGSRCFNCGSYNHTLKECPKPRDSVAVTNARKQHKARRNQNVSSRNPTRYYHNSPGGKYDGLKPGSLDSETRQLLGLRELDPPPWLNRMREIGYPPGYLDTKDEDIPSGITIFGDDEKVGETEEGEILETSFTEPDKKMSVEFPGVNAPIPENADKKLWVAGAMELGLHRNRSYSRFNWTSDSGSRSHYHEQKLSRGFEDDDFPPPGCEGERPTSSDFRGYAGFDSAYSSHIPRESPVPRSSSFLRSFSDRARRNPVVHDGSSMHFSYGSLPYSSPR